MVDLSILDRVFAMELSELGLRILGAYNFRNHMWRDSDFINRFNIPEEDIQEELLRLHKESFVEVKHQKDFHSEGYYIVRILPKGRKAIKNPDKFMQKKTNLSKVKVDILRAIKYLLNQSPGKCAVGYEDIANYLEIDKSRVSAQLDELNNQPDSKKLIADVNKIEDTAFTGNFYAYDVGLSLRGRNLIEYPDDFEDEDTSLIQNTTVSIGENSTVNNFQMGKNVAARDITQSIGPKISGISECIKHLISKVDQFPEYDRERVHDALIEIDNAVSVAEPDPANINGLWAHLATILSSSGMTCWQGSKWIINKVPGLVDFSEKLSSLYEHLKNIGLIKLG